LILFSIFIFQVSVMFATSYKVANITEFDNQVKNLQPGDSIILAKGVWKDAQLVFFGEGTEQQPITLTVEEPGQTTIEGQSSLNLYGKYLVVDGLVFVNGYSPGKSVIEFRRGTSKTAYNSVVKNCVVDFFNRPNRYDEDHWVDLWGQHNVVENCYFGGKKNQGTTFVVWPNGEGHNQNYHQIRRNYFGPRPRLGSNGGETMRIGTSEYSLEISGTVVEGNYFERCNGEVEIISNKSCENRIINNTFVECEGSVVLRHGNRNEVSGNYFFGNGKENTGGVRVINAGHKIFNNYFYGLKGKDFRAPLVIMNGVPNSPANRYNQVKDVEIMFNTWVDCDLPWQFCVGSDAERTDIPQNVLIANNIVYCPEEPLLIKAFDKIDGIQFKDNILVSNHGNEVGDGFLQAEILLRKGQGGLPLALTKKTTSQEIAYVKTDIDGRTRAIPQAIGAFEMTGGQATIIQASRKNCGPSWYKPLEKASTPEHTPVTFQITPGQDNLYNAVKKSKPGDIIELTEGEYVNSKKMLVYHPLTIRAKADAKARPVIKMNMDATATVAFFELKGGSVLHLEGVALDGNLKSGTAKYAFVTGKEDMTDSYKTFIDNCDIYNFKDTNGGCIFKTYKTSFADTIQITNSILRDSFRGLALNDEKDDVGIYSAEYTIFINTVFKDIEQWALDFYRGGNDESTLGGFLEIDHCVFDNVFSKENQTMIRQTGLINIDITNTIFCNSSAKFPVKSIGKYNAMKNCCIYDAGKVSATSGATTENIYVDNPRFKKNTFYQLDDKSPLRGKATNGGNIGLK
ncbi:MAG: polysaccharide lyase 6 family protein, partial [Candidatus Azobacteroides sp.]|nr:polysaccharide lyase 6 family protein [Candidatus Azobacteroides sp.]